MSEVFYRKWRPRRLGEVVGQEAVVQTLRNAVAQSRTAHAYLFCGPRGTGKTSTARILAKAVNCRAPQDGEPDDQCDICVAINESRALDLIEIDAASNRGIDDIRDLREKVHFAPNEATYKVYIIDEVHMLTDAAFNALLKTLEEPPSHAIFILATTEAHKVPLTIVSRCQRFDFRRIPLDSIVQKLGELCVGESIEADDEALALIARASSGSLRDAENLLEQALVSYGSPISEEQLRDLLEMGSDERALRMAGHVVDKKVKEGLTLINEVAAEGTDLRQFHRGLLEYLRGVLIFKSGAEATLGHPKETEDELRSLADKTTIEHLVYALKTFTNAEVKRESLSPLALELALVESSVEPAPAARPVETAAPRTAPQRPAPRRSVKETAPAPAAQKPEPTPAPSHSNGGPSVAAQPRASEPVGPVPTDPTQRLEHGWGELLNSLRTQKGRRFNIGALLRSCVAREVVDDTVVMKFAHRSHMERMQEELEDPQTRRVLAEALATVMEREYEIKVSAADGQSDGPRQSASQRSHLVRAAQSMGAMVVGETPVEDKENVDDEQKDAQAGPGASEADAEDAGGA